MLKFSFGLSSPGHLHFISEWKRKERAILAAYFTFLCIEIKISVSSLSSTLKKATERS